MSEFDLIAELFAPLTCGGAEALGLLDDAAALPSRPGFDLVVTKDALVEGVHFLSGTAPDAIARKLLRCNLSDLAAKGAEPYGYFLAAAWPPGWGRDRRAVFAKGLMEDQTLYNARLLGGDTVSTTGPLVVSMTAMGWVEAGRMVRRAGAQAGDLLAVTGTIGDAGLGLQSLQGRLPGATPEDRAFFEARHLEPVPRLEWRALLHAFAKACADVSDGLLADAGHLAQPFGLGVEIDLERAPLSPPAARWLAGQAEEVAARLALAVSGDDYELVFAFAREDEDRLLGEAARLGLSLSVIGRITPTQGVVARHGGRSVPVTRLGWTHG